MNQTGLEGDEPINSSPWMIPYMALLIIPLLSLNYPLSSLPWSLQTQDGLWAVGAGSRKRARIRAAKVALAVAAKLGALHVFVEIGEHKNI